MFIYFGSIQRLGQCGIIPMKKLSFTFYLFFNLRNNSIYWATAKCSLDADVSEILLLLLSLLWLLAAKVKSVFTQQIPGWKSYRYELIYLTALWGKHYYFPHFTNIETKAWRSWLTHSGPLSKKRSWDSRLYMYQCLVMWKNVAIGMVSTCHIPESPTVLSPEFSFLLPH